MELIIPLALFVFFTHLIAKHIGSKRAIGYKNSVFWCMMLSPVGGLLIALSSQKLEDKSEDEDQNEDEDTNVVDSTN